MMWDQRYSETGFAYGTEPNDFLKFAYAHIPQGGHVLCLAEGEGRNAVFLAQQGYQVTAVDQSAVGLDKAQALAKQNGVNITTIVADLADFDFGIQAWDGIVSIFAHVPPLLRKALHKKVVKSLCDDGVFILEAYTLRHIEMDGVGGPPAAATELFMCLDELSEELSDLTMLHAKAIDRHISEGQYHVGHSAVVQIIGRK
jgi:cyclopropane fatty-acyl-phospholipid synthase-like methyltransferase